MSRNSVSSPSCLVLLRLLPARQVELRGVDQISAKVSGTTLKVSPGSYNKGMFVKITGGPGEGDQYHIITQLLLSTVS